MKLTKVIALFLAVMLCIATLLPAGAVNASDAQAKADILNELGLFNGTDKGYELDRKPTRMEAIIMLIRMTGKENDALYGEWSHPFTDAPTWEGAEQYLGYAYENGLTTGATATTFDPNATATAQMYVTFMLRALGYEDEADQKVWDIWEKLGKVKGILPTEVNKTNFTRGDAVVVSYAALSAWMEGTETPLALALMDMGTFNALTYAKGEILAGKKVTTDSALIDIAAQIYLGSEIMTNYLGINEINDDMLSYFLGVEKLDYEEALAIEPMMSSNAHSVCVVRMKDGANAEKAAKDIKASVDPRKWVCVGVEPEHVHTVVMGDIVVLIMDNNNDALFLENLNKIAK